MDLQSFSQFTNELNEAITVDGNKVQFREKGRDTGPTLGYTEDTPIGWYSNRYNPAAGFVIYPMSKADKAWFKSQNESTAGVFRMATDNQTTLIKVDFVANKITHFNTKKYEETDKITWEKRKYVWKEFFIDNNARAFKAFNVNGKSKW